MAQSTPIKYGIVINASKCIDCKACMIACKVENQLPSGYWRNWIRPLWFTDGTGKCEFQPGQCMQCDTPACVAACPVGATHKRGDGLVAIDATKCVGCGNCVTACPYGARYRNPESRVADKCDFCQHRLARGLEPACVVTCPTRARVFGDLNDPQSAVRQLLDKEKLVRIIGPHSNTQPNIYYHEGTQQLDWAVSPTLPGNVHMPSDFWKTD
jgi:Fe-S-cluster-containing dehydrogenase component